MYRVFRLFILAKASFSRILLRYTEPLLLGQKDGSKLTERSHSKRSTQGGPFTMAGSAGFEPANARTKTWCLTTWRRPNNRIKIVAYYDVDVKGICNRN